MELVSAVLKDDLRLLKKYSLGRDVEESDTKRLDELARVGLIKKGLSLERAKLTARTTQMGSDLTSR